MGESYKHVLTQQLADKLNIHYALGGLAPDSDVPMADEMQTMLQQIWSRIHQQLGTEFNFEFWKNCQPKRSTYPACRAILVARESRLRKTHVTGDSAGLLPTG